MALPMVHLLAAYEWAQDREELRNCAEYYLGTISPDAVHVRDGSDKSRKDDVHLNNWRRPNEEAVAEFWRDHHTPFDIGYGIHVLLDGHWAASFRRDFPQILNPNGKPIPQLYYHDTYLIDRKLYETDNKVDFFMKMLRDAEVPKELIIPPNERLTEREFAQWRIDMENFYAGPARENGEPVYITHDYTMEFLKCCSGIFSRVWNLAMNTQIK